MSMLQQKPTAGGIVEDTRANIQALVTAGTLVPGAFYQATDVTWVVAGGTATFTAMATETNSLSDSGVYESPLLNPGDPWEAIYDWDNGEIVKLTDTVNENTVMAAASTQNFPFGNTLVTGNDVDAGLLVYTAGNFRRNVIRGQATVTVVSGNVARNYFEAQSNTTITSSDFIENRVENDATVVTTTTGDVDGNTFANTSSTTVSGTANVDNSQVLTAANLTVTGGTIENSTFKDLSNTTINGGFLRETTVMNDADLTLNSGDNYENVFGGSTVFNQVGTGYVRYSRINGTTTWTNGNTNVSDVIANTATVNTTGSAGTIANSTLDRAYCIGMQNIASLTITDSTISNYGQVLANGAARLYFYRSTNTDGSRILVSAGSRIDASYTNLDSYSYLQSTGNGGFLSVNYCNLSSLGYIRNLTTNTNYADRCNVSSQSNIRFDGNANNCRVYYSSADGGGAIYHTGNSDSCYIYYGHAGSFGQIYTNNSVNARMYYVHADSSAFIISQGNTTTHYMYYCNAKARGYLYTLNNTAVVQMYGCSASDVAQIRLQNTSVASNLYYSKVDSYYYLYANMTGGTRSGLFGMGRRTYTVTNPTAGTPYAVGASWQNIL